jgi:hypothetical protein
LAAMNTRGNLLHRTWFLMDQAQIHKFIYTNKYCPIYKRLESFNDAVCVYIVCQL